MTDDNPHGEGDDRQVTDRRGTPGVDPEAAQQPDPGDADDQHDGDDEPDDGE